MKKLLIAVAVGTLLSACGTTNSSQQRADIDRTRQERAVEKTISQAPDWFIKRPKNTAEIVYGIGYGQSTNLNSAIDIAENEAYRQICSGAAGIVDSQTKTFRTDRDGQGSSISTTAIRTRCAGVDITGTEIEQHQLTNNGNRFTYYVLVALPLGDANTRLRAKEAAKQINDAMSQSDREFKELDNVRPKAKSSDQSVSVVAPDGTSTTLNLMPVENAEYKARRAEAIQKPGAVVGQVTINN
jgi:hypothetical protein